MSKAVRGGSWITHSGSGNISDRHKVGETVSGVRAVVHSKGKELHGKIVYKRKADYKEDPFTKRA